MQTAVEGIVKGNVVVVRNGLRRFDGRGVRVTLLDAKNSLIKRLNAFSAYGKTMTIPYLSLKQFAIFEKDVVF